MNIECELVAFASMNVQDVAIGEPLDMVRLLRSELAAQSTSYERAGMARASTSVEAHALQGLRDPATIRSILRFNGTVFHLRNLIKRGMAFN